MSGLRKAVFRMSQEKKEIKMCTVMRRWMLASSDFETVGGYEHTWSMKIS